MVGKGEKSNWWKGGKVQLTCSICKNNYERFPSQKDSKYCSKDCYYKTLKGRTAPNKGIKHSEEHKKKISEGLKRAHREGRRVSWNKGKSDYKCHSEEWKAELSKRFKKNNPMSDPLKRKKMSETQKRLFKEGKRKPTWKKGKPVPQFVSSNKNPKHIKKRLKGLMKRPTSIETKLIKIMEEEHLPFKYVGDGEVIIDCLNPDFIHTNGKKKLIEVYWKFFKEKGYGSVEEYEKKKSERFAKYGFETLFIKMSEFSNIEEVKRKVIKFEKQ